MARNALCDEPTGLIENIIEIDPEKQGDPRRAYRPPPGKILVEDLTGAAARGGTWDGAAFLPPPPPDPMRLAGDLERRIAADMASAAEVVHCEILEAVLGGLRAVIPDFDTRLAPAWLAGAATAAAISDAIAARRLELALAGQATATRTR